MLTVASNRKPATKDGTLLIVSKTIFFLFCVFEWRSLLHSPSCPGSHYIDQTSLGLTEDTTASAFPVLGLKAHTTTSVQHFWHCFKYMIKWSVVGAGGRQRRAPSVCSVTAEQNDISLHPRPAFLCLVSSSLGSPLISCSSWILLLKWLVRDRSELPECFFDPTLWSGAPMPFHWYHVTFCHILSLCLPVISEVILGSSHLLLDTGSVPLSSSNTTGGLLDWALDVHGLCFS